MDTMFSSGSRHLRIVRLEGVLRQPFGLGDDILKPRQRGKRRELGRAVVHRHAGMLFRHMVRQMKNVVVGIFHFITFSNRKKYSPPGSSHESCASGWCGLKNSTI